jgi:hypothetical protein
MTYYLRYNFYPTNVPVNLTPGTNWIGVEVHLASPSATAMGFDVELIGNGYLPLPSLSISPIGDNQIGLAWPLPYSSNFSLYSSTNLGAPNSWSALTDPLYTNGGQITTTQSLDSTAKFFRLQQP